MGEVQETKSQRKSKYKAAGKAYAKMLKPLGKDKVPYEYRRDAQAQFLHEYREVIEEYINDSELSSDSISDDFSKLVRMYKANYLKSGKSLEENEKAMGARAMRTSGATAMIRKGMDKAGAQLIDENSAETVNSQDNLTGAQMAGLKDISRWMLRNMDKTGPFGDSKGPYVRGCVLKQPARVKLCAYYLVETDARKLTGKKLKEAVVKSQSPEYVPNLQRFKDKMVATKFKFWKRFNGGEFYWDKLAESMRFAMKEQATILKFGELGSSEVTESDADGDAKAQPVSNQGSGSGAGTAAQGKEKAIENQYKAFMQLTNYIVKLQEKRDKKGGEWTEDDKKMLDAATLEYLKYGKSIVDAIESGESGDLSTSSSIASDIESLYGIAKIAESGAGTGLSKGADMLLKAGEAADITKLTGNWLGAASGITAFAGFVTNVIRMGQKNSYTSAGVKTERLAESLSSLSEMASKGLASYKKLAGIAEKSTFDLQSGGIANMVTGSINVAAGLTTVVSAGVEKHHLTKATKAIKKNKDITNEEAQKTEQAAALQRRLAGRRQVNGTMKMVSGGLQVAAGALMFSGVGIPLATILEMAATGMSLVQGIYNFFQKKADLKASIDEYIHMDKVFPKVDNMAWKIYTDKYNKGEATMMPPEEDEMKKYIRLEAAAQAGCYSLEDFYNLITREYATLIYSKAMLQDDGETPVKIVGGEPQLTQTNKDFAELLKGYGLKPDYKKGKPTINTIQKKMANG